MIVRVHIEIIDTDRLNKTIDDRSYESVELPLAIARETLDTIGKIIYKLGFKLLL